MSWYIQEVAPRISTHGYVIDQGIGILLTLLHCNRISQSLKVPQRHPYCYMDRCSSFVRPSMDSINAAGLWPFWMDRMYIIPIQIGWMDTESMDIHGFGPQIPSWMDLDWISIQIPMDGFWINPLWGTLIWIIFTWYNLFLRALCVAFSFGFAFPFFCSQAPATLSPLLHLMQLVYLSRHDTYQLLFPCDVH